MKIIESNQDIKNINADCEIIVTNEIKEDKRDLKLLGFEGSSEEVAFLPHLNKIYVAVIEIEI